MLSVITHLENLARFPYHILGCPLTYYGVVVNCTTSVFLYFAYYAIGLLHQGAYT